MRRIKLIIFSVFLIAAMFSLTACRNKNGTGNMSTQSSTENTTQNASQSGSSNAYENTSGTTELNETSTGAVQGVMDDIETGIDDITETTNRAQG